MCTDRKAGREGSKTRQRDRDMDCRTNNGGQVTGNRTEQSIGLAYPMSAVTCKGSFLSLAPSLWSYDRPYSCEQNTSPALPSPHLECILSIPGTSLGTPSLASTLLKILTLARVRCRVLWSLPRKSIALGVPEEAWLTGSASRVQLSALLPLYPRPPPRRALPRALPSRSLSCPLTLTHLSCGVCS